MYIQSRFEIRISNRDKNWQMVRHKENQPAVWYALVLVSLRASRLFNPPKLTRVLSWFCQYASRSFKSFTLWSDEGLKVSSKTNWSIKVIFKWSLSALSKSFKAVLPLKLWASDSKKWVVSSQDLICLRIWLLWLLLLVETWNGTTYIIYERLQIISSIL